MPSYTPEQLRRELGMIDTVSIPSRSNFEAKKGEAMGEVKQRPLDETKTLIKSVIKKEKRAMTFREIARSIDRKPTPRLRGILNDMVRDGELVQSSDTAIAGNMERFWYSLPGQSKR